MNLSHINILEQFGIRSTTKIAGGKNMNWQTKKKIDDILEQIKSGTEFKYIVKTKFKGTAKYYDEWLDKIKDELDKKTYKILSEAKNKKAVKVKKEKEKHEIALPAHPVFKVVNSPEKLSALNDLLIHSEDLMKLLQGKPEGQEMDSHDILHISGEVLKLKDTKIKSMRISETLLKKFDALADEHPNYTKTNLINAAISEFVEKYSK